MKATKINNGFLTIKAIKEMNVIQLRSILLAINKLQRKFNVFRKEMVEQRKKQNIADKYLVSEAFNDFVTISENYNKVSIPYSEIIRKSNKTKDKVKEDIIKIMHPIFKSDTKGTGLFSEVEYLEDENKFVIEFIEKRLEEILAPGEKFFIIDLEIIEQLRGEYEIGLYMLYRQFIKQGFLKMNTEKVREYFNTSITRSTGSIYDTITRASRKLNELIGYTAIKVTTEKEKKFITKFLFTFKEEKVDTEPKQKSYKDILRNGDTEYKGITYEDVIRNNGLDETDYSEVF